MGKVTESHEIEWTYDMLDGNVITIGSEMLRCPEMLFKPHFDGMEYEGIDETVYDSIMKCDIDVRRELYGNIVLSRGRRCFLGWERETEQGDRSAGDCVDECDCARGAEVRSMGWRIDSSISCDVLINGDQDGRVY